MTIAIFITIWATTATLTEVDNYFRNEPLAWLKAKSAVNVVEFYSPVSGDLPDLHDSGVPSIMIEIDTESIEEAKDLIYGDDFKKLFTNRKTYPFVADKINVEVLEVVNYDLPGHKQPPPRTAPMSFVVRYYGPVKDESKFVELYTKSHPSVLAEFPGIRNVLCYLPINWQSTKEVADSRLIIGNEVVFDDLAALNHALQSPIMNAVREDGRQLAKINIGDGTHHAMARERVYSRMDVE